VTNIDEYRNRIICGDALTVLREMPDDSVHCVVTSPPYWGLRKYDAPEGVWGGSKDCEHEWGKEIIHKRGHPGDKTTLVGTQTADLSKEAGHFGFFCVRCGAWRGQLGLEPTPDLYIAHLVEVFREVKRVLRSDGTLWLNMGDSYWGGKGQSGTGNPEEQSERYESGASINRSYHQIAGDKLTRPQDGKHDILKPKDLVAIPWRVAFALQADGWYLRSDIIWSKPNPMPESVQDRPTKSHEYIFLLSKSGRTQFWTHRELDGTREKPKPDYRYLNMLTDEEFREKPPDYDPKLKVPCPVCGGEGRLFEAFECENCEGKGAIKKWKRINLWQGHDYFYDADAIRENGITKHMTGRNMTDTRITHGLGGGNQGILKLKEKYHELGVTTLGRNKRSVWTIPTASFKGAHFAVFPEALVEPMVMAGTSQKGCCVKCGGPMVRVVEIKRSYESGSGKSGNKPQGKGAGGVQSEGSLEDDIRAGPTIHSKTVGWEPSCECGISETVPCIVLDPFVGSGTVCLVAAKLNRDWIGIDISEKYCAMARERLAPYATKLEAFT